jgi:hypothetical protein
MTPAGETWGENTTSPIIEASKQSIDAGLVTPGDIVTVTPWSQDARTNDYHKKHTGAVRKVVSKGGVCRLHFDDGVVSTVYFEENRIEYHGREAQPAQ